MLRNCRVCPFNTTSYRGALSAKTCRDLLCLLCLCLVPGIALCPRKAWRCKSCPDSGVCTRCEAVVVTMSDIWIVSKHADQICRLGQSSFHDDSPARFEALNFLSCLARRSVQARSKSDLLVRGTGPCPALDSIKVRFEAPRRPTKE